MKKLITRFTQICASWCETFLYILASMDDRDSHRPAGCNNILSLLSHLCDMDEGLRLWVLRWLAYPLRNPGAKMPTALIFNGGQGSGKSLLFNQVVKQLYVGTAVTIDTSDLHQMFNSWAQDSRLAVVEGDFHRRDLARLKSLVSSDQLVIQRKGHARAIVENSLNFVFLSSGPDFLPADVGDRRFVVVEVPPARPRMFYQAVIHEMTNGGVDAFRDYLLHGLDMGDFAPSTLPPAAHIHSHQEAA